MVAKISRPGSWINKLSNTRYFSLVVRPSSSRVWSFLSLTLSYLGRRIASLGLCGWCLPPLLLYWGRFNLDGFSSYRTSTCLCPCYTYGRDSCWVSGRVFNTICSLRVLIDSFSLSTAQRCSGRYMHFTFHQVSLMLRFLSSPTSISLTIALDFVLIYHLVILSRRRSSLSSSQDQTPSMHFPPVDPIESNGRPSTQRPAQQTPTLAERNEKAKWAALSFRVAALGLFFICNAIMIGLVVTLKVSGVFSLERFDPAGRPFLIFTASDFYSSTPISYFSMNQ